MMEEVFGIEFNDLNSTFGGRRKTSYSPEASALFAAMTVQPSPARKKLIDDFIIGCKQDGNWSLLDGLWFLAAHDIQAAKICWKNPSLYTLTDVNSPAFTTDRGFAADGVTQYIKTGLVLSAGGLNYGMNSNSYGVYSRTNADELKTDFGAYTSGTTSGTQMNCRNANNLYARDNSNDFPNVANTNSLGLHSVKRTSSASITFYKNNASVGTGVANATAIPTVELYINAVNFNGGPSNFSTKQIAFAFVGGNIDVVKLSNRVTTYLTAIGANV